MATIYTIGHSTRGEDEFIQVLQTHGIVNLADIRAFPMSRRLPQFNREPLLEALARIGIAYRWIPEMGGRRKKQGLESPNTALRNESFRNYADYMLTPKFQRAAADLLNLALTGPTAYMCAERLYFHCHRMLVSDYYTIQGHEVLHILDREPSPRVHKLTPEASWFDGRLLYRGGRLV